MKDPVFQYYQQFCPICEKDIQPSWFYDMDFHFANNHLPDDGGCARCWCGSLIVGADGLRGHLDREHNGMTVIEVYNQYLLGVQP